MNASQKAKHQPESMNLNSLSCQTQQSFSVSMKVKKKFSEKYNKTLMSILFLQMFQQQQTVLKNCREYFSSSLYTNYAASAAEYIFFLFLLLLHSASSLKIFSQYCSSSKQFLLLLNYKKNHTTCLANSSVRFIDNRESHLWFYIN